MMTSSESKMITSNFSSSYCTFMVNLLPYSSAKRHDRRLVIEVERLAEVAFRHIALDTTGPGVGQHRCGDGIGVRTV